MTAWVLVELDSHATLCCVFSSVFSSAKKLTSCAVCATPP